MRVIPTAVLLGCFSVAAMAQTQNRAPAPAPDTSARTPAVASPDKNNPGAPVAGATSFTEGQAKSRIESQGFTNVTDLKKDDKGVWMAKASKGGKSTSVALDYQGNVVAK